MKICNQKSPRYALLLLAMTVAFAMSTAQATQNTTVLNPVYDYPIENNLISTLSSAVSHPTHQAKRLHIEVRKDRRNIPSLEGRNRLAVHLYKQAKPAPLMFLIPGLGGGAGSGTALMLAETFFQAGYNVVTLPNNLSWQYALSVSETMAPGYMPRDSKEYYEFLKFITESLQAREHIQPTGYAISGFSLGGLLAAFVANVDTEQQDFKFQKVILINPAVDVEYGVQILDQMYAAGNGLSEKKKTEDLGFVINMGVDLMGAPLTLPTLQGAVPKLARLSDNEIRWLIGQSFRQSVRDVLLTAERAGKINLLKAPISKYRQNAQLDEANKFSVSDYMDLVVLPTLPNGKAAKQQVLADSSLYSLAPMMTSNQNLFVFENSDDLIIKPTDIAFLKSAVGPRLKVYPRGGHLGNLWWNQNKTDLMNAAKIQP